MITVDDRAGSGDLAHLFTSSVRVSRIEAADFNFPGWIGPEKFSLIGIERKTITEITGALDRLVGHQLPLMQAAYGACYLVVEGAWQPDRNNNVSFHNGRTWKDANPGIRSSRYFGIVQQLRTIQASGVTVWKTLNKVDTVRTVEALYKWHTKPWDEHKSINTIYIPPCPVGLNGKPPNRLVKVLSVFDGLGYQTAVKVAAHFGSLEAVINAGVKDLMKVDGIGKVLAERIYRFVRQEFK